MKRCEYIINLRKQTGMTKKEFAAYFEIPYSTLQDWESDDRRITTYLLKLMEYKLRAEGLISDMEETKWREQ